MQFEEQILISAPVEKIFAIYADVHGWSYGAPSDHCAIKPRCADHTCVSSQNHVH